MRRKKRIELGHRQRKPREPLSAWHQAGVLSYQIINRLRQDPDVILSVLSNSLSLRLGLPGEDHPARPLKSEPRKKSATGAGH